MPFQAIASTVEVVIAADRSGEERKNIIHYRYTGALPTAAEMDQLADEVLAGIVVAQGVITCLGTNWNEIKVSEMSTAGGMVRVKSVNYNGTALGGVLPGNSSHCLTKRTSFRGASFRGRFYLFDLPEGYFDGDDMAAAFLPFTTNLANQLLMGRVGSKFTPAVGSRSLHTSTLFNAITFDLIADSQYRRLKKRGR